MPDHDFGLFGDDITSPEEDRENELDEAREEAFEAGKEEGRSRHFGCGCLTGIALTLTAIYMGWCSPYTH